MSAIKAMRLCVLAVTVSSCGEEPAGSVDGPTELVDVIVSQKQALGNSCDIVSQYTTTKDCGYDGVYVGPNKPEEHGGVCLYTGPQCILTSRYTLTKNCGTGWVYAGPNMPDLHGGVCLRELNGTVLYTFYTTIKSCPYGGIYVGPNRPDLHGGYCLYTD
ncbi:hypothetical protein F0U62_47975 [Cystobacter fuscus]|uniref:hypothetical protein n=1 Tax=Cystobacter fuscus TaxID=43 RepID=UPI002B31BCFD|nr:hypothetical protein F0U62_47975 [Cystobacter fuscus]